VITQTDIDAQSWFHGIDFGDGRAAKGRLNPPNWSLYGAFALMEHINFSNCRVLDIGTMDGIVGFMAERLGAREVICTDLYDRKTFGMAKDILGSKAQYLPRTGIADLLSKFGTGSFDVVVMGGLLYHLVSPLIGIMIGRSLLKNGGVLVLETVATEGETSTLTFNPSDPVIDEYTTFFVPTVKALQNMMTFSLMDILGTSSVRATSATRPYLRTSILARAVYPGIATSDLMGRTQERAKDDSKMLEGHKLSDLAHSPSVEIAIDLDAIRKVPPIVDRSFKTKLPFQPNGKIAAKV
jgi:tRNA (mo5U34)-methyltransferase